MQSAELSLGSGDIIITKEVPPRAIIDAARGGRPDIRLDAVPNR